MFCSSCGNELNAGAKFCDSCGASMSSKSIDKTNSLDNTDLYQKSKSVIGSMVGDVKKFAEETQKENEVKRRKMYKKVPKAPTENDKKIAINLKKFGKHRPIKCLECGYDGLAGIKKEWKPWYAGFWFCFLMLCTGIGIAWVFLMLLMGEAVKEQLLECPNCLIDINPNP